MIVLNDSRIVNYTDKQGKIYRMVTAGKKFGLSLLGVREQGYGEKRVIGCCVK